jgi:hypothetical protein
MQCEIAAEHGFDRPGAFVRQGINHQDRQ